MLVHSALGRLRTGVLVLTAAECLRSFMAAVNDGRRGDFGRAKELVERVRGKHGDQAAELAKKELWRCIRSDKLA